MFCFASWIFLVLSLSHNLLFYIGRLRNMGKVNKRLSFSPQRGKPKKNKLKHGLSQEEKKFILTNYLGSQSLKVVQQMFVKKFPKAKIPSFKLIYNLSKSSANNLHISNNNTSAENNCPNNNTMSVTNTSKTVTKHKSLRVINNLKNKKGKHKKIQKLLKLRASQLLQKASKVNTQNISNAAECLTFNSQNSINGSPSTSFNFPDSSKKFCPPGKKNLKRGREEDSRYPIKSLDSPNSKPSIRYQVICEIDLTASPGNNNNVDFKNIPHPNSHLNAISTPFSYSHVAGLRSSPNFGAVSPINKKLVLSIDDADSLRRSNDNDTSKATFIYQQPEFITVDRYDLGQSSRDETTQNTVICVDNEETVLQTENPDDSLILDASDIEFVSTNNILRGELNNEKLFQVHSIDLTDSLKENMPALSVPATQPVVYDLTLDNSHDSSSSSSLFKKREQILLALGQTTEDSSNKYTKTKRVHRTGSNIYFPANNKNIERTGPRMVVIDGSNVAMGHRHGKSFSVEGLKQCIQYFLDKGHEVKAFVPRFRNKKFKSTNPRLLDQLEEKGHVVYTPSREIKGKLITSYDDRYIVQCAVEYGGVIISNDNFRDLLRENEAWRETIEERLLPFTWVGDMIIFPQDPLGKDGPILREFLCHPDPKTK